MTEPVAVEGALRREPDALAAPSQSVAASAAPAAAAPTANEATMGTGVGEGGGVKQEEPKVSWQDIKSVQNLIERCLQKFMTQTEIIAALQVEASIDPSFTCLVWQKLEQQNPEFFFSYHARLKMRDQIVAFNYLVDQQVYLIRVASAGMMPHQPPPGMHPGMPQGMPPGMVPHHPLAQHHPHFAPQGMPTMPPPARDMVAAGGAGGRQTPRQQTPPPPMHLPSSSSSSSSSIAPPPIGHPSAGAFPPGLPGVPTPSTAAASLPVSAVSAAAPQFASALPQAPAAVAASVGDAVGAVYGSQAARAAVGMDGGDGDGGRREVSSTAEGIAVGGVVVAVGVKTDVEVVVEAEGAGAGAGARGGGGEETEGTPPSVTSVVSSVREGMEVDVGGGEPEEGGVIDVV